MAGSTRGSREDDWVVPFPKPRPLIADARSFRSTWITASQATLRERGHFARYEAAIAPQHKERVLGAVPGVWLAMEIAIAHYEACDSLALPMADLLAIGNAATKRANAATFAMIARLAQGAGATPWTVLRQTPRLWSLTVDGGAIAVARLGPKEARVEIVGFPLARIAYNRVTLRGILSAAIERFCAKVYTKELPELCDHRSFAMRAAWA